MFDLQNGKSKDNEEHLFELEQQAQDSDKAVGIIRHIESRLQEIRASLRKGNNKEEYAQLGTILHGYAALLKVVGRIKKKGK